MCWRVCPAQLVQLPAAGVFAAFSDWLCTLYLLVGVARLKQRMHPLMHDQVDAQV